ncbi:unnamed protein product [Sphagnum troendelagicum]|uniref:Uncharacterized protein n=1 Tax=Sphagnum troendelagicum TaxID=128251 RepID=A0ABP0TXN9_9BRYO
MSSFLVKEVQRTPASSSSSPSLRSFDDQIPALLRAAIRNRKHCTEMKPLKPSKELEHEISTRLLHFTPHYCSPYHESVYRQHSFRLYDFNTSTTGQGPASPSSSKVPEQCIETRPKPKKTQSTSFFIPGASYDDGLCPSSSSTLHLRSSSTHPRIQRLALVNDNL